MKTDNPLTVCFYVQDAEKFRDLADKFFESMARDNQVSGAYVTAIGRSDLFAEVEAWENGEAQ